MPHEHAHARKVREALRVHRDRIQREEVRLRKEIVTDQQA